MSADERKKVDKHIKENQTNEKIFKSTSSTDENTNDLKIPVPHHSQKYCFKCFETYKDYIEVIILTIYYKIMF